MGVGAPRPGPPRLRPRRGAHRRRRLRRDDGDRRRQRRLALRLQRSDPGRRRAGDPLLHVGGLRRRRRRRPPAPAHRDRVHRQLVPAPRPGGARSARRPPHGGLCRDPRGLRHEAHADRVPQADARAPVAVHVDLPRDPGGGGADARAPPAHRGRASRPASAAPRPGSSAPPRCRRYDAAGLRRDGRAPRARRADRLHPRAGERDLLRAGAGRDAGVPRPAHGGVDGVLPAARGPVLHLRRGGDDPRRHQPPHHRPRRRPRRAPDRRPGAGERAQQRVHRRHVGLRQRRRRHRRQDARAGDGAEGLLEAVRGGRDGGVRRDRPDHPARHRPPDLRVHRRRLGGPPLHRRHRAGAAPGARPHDRGAHRLQAPRLRPLARAPGARSARSSGTRGRRRGRCSSRS